MRHPSSSAVLAPLSKGWLPGFIWARKTQDATRWGMAGRVPAPYVHQRPVFRAAGWARAYVRHPDLERSSSSGRRNVIAPTSHSNAHSNAHSNSSHCNFHCSPYVHLALHFQRTRQSRSKHSQQATENPATSIICPDKTQRPYHIQCQLQSRLPTCSEQRLRGPTMRPSVRHHPRDGMDYGLLQAGR